jgi:hypothetical protein
MGTSSNQPYTRFPAFPWAILVVLLGLALTSVAYPATPAQDFVDRGLLLESGVEILAMNRDQLETFIDYVAICSTASEKAGDEFQCDAATEKVIIKNSQSPALLRIVRSVALESRLIASSWEGSTGASRERLASAVMRTSDIFDKFGSSAAIRYTELSKQSAAARSR